MKKILFLLIYLFSFGIAGCSTLPNVEKPNNSYSKYGVNKIYIVSHGWHTGFVIPAEDLQSRIPDLKMRFPNAQNMEIGWGDKGFYQSKEITVGLTLQAIFMPTESVIHAVQVPFNVHRFFSGSEIEEICLNDDEYYYLIKFISNSFERDNKGSIIPQRSGIYGDSQFYNGMGDYYLMNTCNKWTAKGLSSAGLEISPTFKLTAGSIMNYLKEDKGFKFSCN